MYVCITCIYVSLSLSLSLYIYIYIYIGLLSFYSKSYEEFLTVSENSFSRFLLIHFPF